MKSMGLDTLKIIFILMESITDKREGLNVKIINNGSTSFTIGC
jgi:hypothetical protein